jgi:hypothetical protein
VRFGWGGCRGVFEYEKWKIIGYQREVESFMKRSKVL